MKKHLVLLLFVIIATSSFGQNNYQDVVYLKNGSIIRGIIVEQVPNQSIKIETADRNVFVFQIDEIEKLTKENIAREKRAKPSDKRRGYIGLTIGPSIPVGLFDDPSNGLAATGLQLNLINFGYLFSDNLGIAGTWFGAANPIDGGRFDPWSYGGLMVGVLGTHPLSDIVDWDLKPMIGYAVTTLPNIGQGAEQASSFAFSLGTQLRFNVRPKLSLLFSMDYFSTKPTFVGNNLQQQIGTVSLNFGVAYRLK